MMTMLVEKDLLKLFLNPELGITLFDNSPSALTIKDASSLEYMYLNQAAQRLFGLTNQEAQGKTDFDLFPTQQAESFLKFDKAAMAQGKPLSSSEQVVFCHYHGARYIKSTKIPVIKGFDGTDIIITMSAQLPDNEVPGREQSHHEEQFRRLFEVSGAGKLISGFDGRFLKVNDSFCKFIGYSREELLSMTFQEITYPEDVPFSEQQMRKLISGELKSDTFQFNKRYVRKDGEVVWGRISVALVRDKSGKPVYKTGEIEDITEQKLASEQLSKLRNYLKNIIDSMPSVLVGVDASGKVTQWNTEAQNATGISAEAAEGQLLATVFPFLQNEIKNVELAIKEHKAQLKTRIAHKTSNGVLFFDITVYPLASNGTEGAVIRMDDVTEQVRLEEIMIHSEKMLSIGSLAAGMAHEINNPLAGIVQGTQLIQNHLSLNNKRNIKIAEQCGTSMADIHKYMVKRNLDTLLNLTVESGKRVFSIVDGMLRFSRKSELKLAMHQMTTLFDDTIELLQTGYFSTENYNFKDVKIERYYEENLPEIECEGSKIQQVFLNVLQNGSYAMAKEKELSDNFDVQSKISKFAITIRRDGDKNVKIEIADNGPGMTAEAERRVFEPFFTTKEEGQGTGLGLSVSHFIVTENHRGTIGVESVVGKGSKFTIRLPLKLS